MIVFKEFSVKYGADAPVIRNMSAVVAAGACTALLGKSGAGKTSLLRSIAGLQPYQGSIEINGKKLGEQLPFERAHLVGYVFQEFNLFPTLTVLENCVQPLCVVKKMTRQEATIIARRWLTRLGVGEFCERMPNELSGGQQQRVALARTLAFEPACVLLDEPTAALDPENTQVVCDVIRDLCSRRVTVVVVSHDLEFVRAVADQFWLLENGVIIERRTRGDAQLFEKTSRIGTLLRCVQDSQGA